VQLSITSLTCHNTSRSSFRTFGSPSYPWNGCSYKVQILGTNASSSLLPADRNYAGMRRVSQNIISREKFIPTSIMCYVRCTLTAAQICISLRRRGSLSPQNALSF